MAPLLALALKTVAVSLAQTSAEKLIFNMQRQSDDKQKSQVGTMANIMIGLSGVVNHGRSLLDPETKAKLMAALGEVNQNLEAHVETAEKLQRKFDDENEPS